MERDDEDVIQTPERPPRRGRVGRGLGAGLLAIGLVALGVAAGVWGERRASTSGVARPADTQSRGGPASQGALAMPASPPAASAPTGDVEVVLTPEAVARAGIKTAKLVAVESGASIRVPGTVMANAYREVKVTPIAGGIVSKVHVALGDAVKRGVPLVTLFSADLADAQTKYLSMVAMLEADHRKLDRTRQLFEIGAASRQELEEITAVHAGHATEVEAARQRLFLLGLSPEHVQALNSPSQVVSNVVVPAPIDGAITGRTANLGQVVGMGQELLVVTDLSEVWVIGDLYEQDFQTVRAGSEATLTTPAYPGLTLRGHVTYIDPRVDSQTRTGKVRVEVPNPDGRLRLGMYLSMAFATRLGQRVTLLPKPAVQSLGDRQVVYLPVRDEAGKFVQRSVRLGGESGEHYVVLSGVKPGDVVVIEGSFFLRAEAVRNAPSG